MNLPVKVFDWLKKQYHNHKARSVLAIVLVLSIVLSSIFWATGLFGAREPKDHFTDLPYRAYRLADPSPAEPETLTELLHAENPSIDTLLRKPSIAQELIQAEKLTDVVDSRLALNNLRSLDEQLNERLQEGPDSLVLLDVAELRIHAGVFIDAENVRDKLSYQFLPALASYGSTSTLALNNSVAMNDFVQTSMQALQTNLTAAKTATSRLLKVSDRTNLIAMPANMNIKCVWQAPGEGLVHLLPSGAWLPEMGYKLYRIIGGKNTLIAEKLAAPQSGLDGSLSVAGAAWIKELYEQAALTPAKLAALGMDAVQFNALAYRTDTLQPRARVSGAIDFTKMQEALITIPADLDQKIPETDLLLRQPIYVMGRQENSMYASASIRTAMREKYSVISPQATPLLSSLQSEPGSDPKRELMQSILSARQQIATLSFVDDEFAEAAGFLFRDDLTDLELADGTKITYQVETPDGAISTQSTVTGQETNLTQPQGLMGYGIDGKVPLRWQQASSAAEKAIVSGYWIERKLDGESSFTQVNKEPIVVSYMLDETGVYFESPVLFEDSVDNGRTASYRIRSLDVFGRTSAYSEMISFPVEKVTPPNAPAIDPPVLSTSSAVVSDAARQAIAANAGQLGIVLPIYTDSPDTVRFTIYRAVAHGAQNYGPPEVLANLSYANPLDGATTHHPTEAPVQTRSIIKNRARQLVRTNPVSSFPNLVYFDANVAEGYTYKYWVSAWDSWNNESAWSKSASMGIPSAVKPATPGALSLSMMARELPDFSQEPPGILYNDLISKEDQMAAPADTVLRPYTTDVQTVKSADANGAIIGQYVPAATKYAVVDKRYNNLPDDKYIHLFVAVKGDAVLPDGTARIRWPAYSGDGLAGYAIYVPEFPLRPLEEMQQLTRAELMELGSWRQLNDETLSDNQFVAGGMTITPGSYALFLVCLVPTGAQPGQPASSNELSLLPGMLSHFALLAEGGHVSLSWEAPDDPQIKYYRVYRSEVANFKQPVNESALTWMLVGDQIRTSKFTERVEQTFAHYYYYKVTSVTPWGVESANGSVDRIRVPATKPPQTPTLLLPLSRKDGIQINFSAVSHCSRYEIYRTELPKINEIDMNAFQNANKALFAALFDAPSKQDTFFAGMIDRSLKTTGGVISAKTPITVIDKFKTLTPLSQAGITGKLNAVNDASILASYNQILNNYGPLALADYRNLSLDMLRMILWNKVGELPVDEDTVETVDPATGLLKPLSIIDTTAVYGKIYLYTVQAWNDDNLGSSRPEPVEATRRRNAPFDPITGLKSEKLIGQPSLSWNTPTMANLSWQQCRDDTVGYIVYRSDREDGEYYQASPLLLEPKWIDEQADPYASNWYKVKVLDTGGYLSEFSEPLLVRQIYTTSLETRIPAVERLTPDAIAPDIAVRGQSFSVRSGSTLQVNYTLTGTEPITLTLQAVSRNGADAKGITLDITTKTIRISKDVPVGAYTVTLRAVNKAGEDSASFLLEVTQASAVTPTPAVTPRPTVTPAPVAPTVRLEASSFTIYYQTPFSARYTLTGTEPITLALQVYRADGSLADGFSIDRSARTINATNLRPGQYNGVLSASNSVGKSEARFVLNVVTGTAPVLATREDGYVFEITRTAFPTRDFTVQFSATGTEPLTWTLQPIASRVLYKRRWIEPSAVPSEVTISSTGLMSVKRSIAAGLYAFDVKVANVAGFDLQTIILDVTSSTLSVISSQVSYNLSAAPYRTGSILLSASASPAPTPETSVTPTPVPVETFTSDRVLCLNFVLTEVEMTRPIADETSAFAGRYGYAGTALLDIGYIKPVPVHIINANIIQVDGTDRMNAGTVYLAAPQVLEEIGITLVSMDITPQFERLMVSGFVQNTDESLNLIGDLHTLEFKDAKLRYGYIDILSGLPDIFCQRLLFHDIGQLRILLDGAKSGNPDFIILGSCKVAMKAHLETLSNEGYTFLPEGDLAFNQQGKLRGRLTIRNEQSLQLLVPGGIALRVADAALTYTYENEDPTGHLKGKLVLPFERAPLQTTVAEIGSAIFSGHPITSLMDGLAGAGTITSAQKPVLHDSLLYFGQIVQQNGLRLAPNDLVQQDACSYVNIDVPDWNGKGFLLDSAYMTPTSIADRGLSMDLQKVQAINVTPTRVTVDLDRETSLPKAIGSQTPNETEMDFWVGMVFQGGTLALPPAFIQTSNGEAIIFTLAEGEMIYDLNGFNYQTFLYNPKGVPAQFGEALGGFQDVTVYDCLLDLYANRINLEINAEVVVDLLLKNRVKVKLYTNKEDNADGQAGQFLCSVASTLIENGIAEGIDVRIDGGWVKSDGMHLNGALTIESSEVMAPDPLAFTDLVVPANKKTINGVDASGRKLASAELDKPVNVGFQGFSMEIRAIDLGYRYRAAEVPGTGSVWLMLLGSTQLSDNIPLLTETTDNLIIECPNKLGLPVVIYEASQSLLSANFDGCVDVSGVLVPKLTATGAAMKAGWPGQVSLGPVYASSPVTSPGEGLVEFDTDALMLGFLGGLNALNIDAVTRFGYDMNNSRCYFAVGLLPASEGGAINFGAGDVEDFTGMVVYNMVMSRNEKNQFAFPDDPGQIAGFVENLPVHTASNTFFGAGIRGQLMIAGFCQIRDLYFGFGSGPVVDASGGLYLPLDVPGMIAGDGFKKVGSVSITYSHPERYFSFSMTIDNINVVVAEVGGSIGFEFSPHLFGVYIGYPETLAGNISIFRVGVGIGFRINTDGESFIKAKIEFGVDKSVEIFIVYMRGYLYAGADGGYYFGGAGGDRFVLELYLKGGIEGGIIVAGDRYNIIGFYLDARGRLESRANDAWLLYCSCEVSYSLDLWLFSVEGSVSASFDTTVG